MADVTRVCADYKVKWTFPGDVPGHGGKLAPCWVKAVPGHGWLLMPLGKQFNGMLLPDPELKNPPFPRGVRMDTEAEARKNTHPKKKAKKKWGGR